MKRDDKRVPAAGLEPGDWFNEPLDPSYGARVISARPMPDNPDEYHIELSSFLIVDHDRLFTISRFTPEPDDGNGGQ